jgi:DGQHR domain-containing protein
MSTTSKALPAIKFEQHGYTLYAGVASARDLVDLTAVDHYDSSKPIGDPTQGYQRPPEETRIKRFANFLLKGEGDGLMPTAVTLASREPVQFLNGNGNVGTLVIDREHKPLLVDGQHRIAGFRHAIDVKKAAEFADFELPFVLIDNIDRLREMRQFKVVNSEAKSVRTDLVSVILTELAKAQGKDAIKESEQWRVVAATAVDILNNDATGPWHDITVMPDAKAYGREDVARDPSLKHRRLARATSFMTSVKPVYDWFDHFKLFKGSTLEERAEELAGVLTEYWEALRELLPEAFVDRDDYVIQKTPGVFSLHALLAKPLLSNLFSARLEFTRANFARLLEPSSELTNVDYWRTTAHGASAYGSMKGFSELAELLRDSIKP